MRLFSYKLARDFGFAPNPFHGVCTLATCKPQIRAAASVGDIIIGCGSKTLRLEERILFALRVEGKCSFQEYWDDPRFMIKRPYFGGSQSRAYGDNIYRHGPTGAWIQEKSHHSLPDGAVNQLNLDRDTGADAVLWGHDFVYWGQDAIPIPGHLRAGNGDDLYPAGRNYRSVFDDGFVSEVDSWFRGLNRRGRLGRPKSWD